MNARVAPTGMKVPLVFIVKVFMLGLLIAGYIYFAPQIGKIAWLPQSMRGLYFFLVPSIILSVVRFLILFVYNTKNSDRNVRGNFVLGVNRLTAVLNTVFATVALMILFGIDPRDFIMSMTFVAMAIAVLFRDYITNMISGLIVMFSDQLSVGDRIQVGEHRGRIVDITFANIVLQDEEDDIVMVPNNTVFTATFINLSAHQSSLFSVKFELPLEVALHVTELEEALRLSFIAHPNLALVEDELHLIVTELGKDFVRYKLDLHEISNSNRMHRNLQNEILKEVIKFQRTVLIKSS
ncbi:MAG: mechanosensitive ion channel family protein [Sphingobacterium sp.]